MSFGIALSLWFYRVYEYTEEIFFNHFRESFVMVQTGMGSCFHSNVIQVLFWSTQLRQTRGLKHILVNTFLRLFT